MAPADQPGSSPDEAHEELLRVHAGVDREAAGLAERHRARLQCRRGCADCCQDGLTVLEVEAERIRCAHPDLLGSGAPHPGGRCAFLDGDGACRIYEDRPYVCRTQGLPLRWWEEGPGGGMVEHRDICPLNEEGEPILDLVAEDCWLLGPWEARLAEVQHQAHGRPRRVALRSLFRRKG